MCGKYRHARYHLGSPHLRQPEVQQLHPGLPEYDVGRASTPPRVSGPHDRLQRSHTVPACEVILGVLSRIQSAALAGQGHAGTAARAPARTGTRGSDTASWRPSSPLRAARGLNVGVLAAIPLKDAVPILSTANRSEDFGLLPCSSEQSNELLFAGVMCRPRPLSGGIIDRHRTMYLLHWSRRCRSLASEASREFGERRIWGSRGLFC